MLDERELMLAKAYQTEYREVMQKLDEEKQQDNGLFVAQALYIKYNKPKVIHTTKEGQGHGKGKAELYDIKTGKLWARFEKYPNNSARFVQNFQGALASGEITILDPEFVELTKKYMPNPETIAKLEGRLVTLQRNLYEMGFFLSQSQVLDTFYNQKGFDLEKKHYNGSFYDDEGYDYDGYDRSGYDRQGYSREGRNKEGYDLEGYNSAGYNLLGFNRDGISDIGMRYNRKMRTGEGKKPDYYTAEHEGRFLRFTYKSEFPLKVYSVGIYVPDTANDESKERFSKKDRELSTLIYRGKSFNENRAKAVATFNEMMGKALRKLIWQCNLKGTIHLVCVPSSTVYRLGDTVSYERGFVKAAAQSILIPGCNITDDNDLLRRTHDIESERRSHDRTIERQLESIECTKRLSQEDIYILIDDIVTKGTILAACQKILCSKGANKDNIYKLTLMATRGLNESGDPFYEIP